MRRTLAWFLAIAFAHFVLYSGALQVGFVTDDFLWLAEAGRGGSLLEHATSREPFGYFRPAFQVLVYGLRTTFGLNPVPFHVLSLCASMGAASLLAALLQRLTRNGVAAAVGTALFIVHPCNAIVVAWISSLPTLLATIGILGAALAWHHYRGTGRIRFALLSLLAHAFALLSKESAVICIAWIAMLEVVGRRFGDAPPADRPTRATLGAHILLVATYLGIWAALRPVDGVSLGPDGAADFVRACLDPLTRVAALFLPRQVFRDPFASALLIAIAVVLLRSTPRDRRAWLTAWCGAGTALALVALVPSSLFLWGFPYDKMQRLLHPALPAAALVVACAGRELRNASWSRARWGRLGIALVAAAVFVPFALRSAKIVSGRRAMGAEARQLFEAVRRHEELLLRLERAGAPLTVVGYPADWVYPVAPIRALAPDLEVRVGASVSPAPDGAVLKWHAGRGEFTVKP